MAEPTMLRANTSFAAEIPDTGYWQEGWTDPDPQTGERVATKEWVPPRIVSVEKGELIASDHEIVPGHEGLFTEPRPEPAGRAPEPAKPARRSRRTPAGKAT